MGPAGPPVHALDGADHRGARAESGWGSASRQSSLYADVSVHSPQYVEDTGAMPLSTAGADQVALASSWSLLPEVPEHPPISTGHISAVTFISSFAVSFFNELRRQTSVDGDSFRLLPCVADPIAIHSIDTATTPTGGGTPFDHGDRRSCSRFSRSERTGC
jgi:hypothetical protein